MKNFLKYGGLALLSSYSLLNVYEKITLDNGGIGLWFVWDIPLGVANLLLAVFLIKTEVTWQRVIAIFGIISSILLLIPPHIYSWIFG